MMPETDMEQHGLMQRSTIVALVSERGAGDKPPVLALAVALRKRGHAVHLLCDGDVAEASVLAGADGIKSIVRKHVLEPIYPSQVRPVYADSYCYRAVIPMAEAYEILGDLTDVAKFFFGHRRGGISYRISGGEVSCH